LLIIKMDRM